MTRVVCFLFCTAWLSACTVHGSLPDGYAVHIAVSLRSGPDNISDLIEVLEDARIQQGMRQAISDAYGENPCADQPPAVLHSLCDAPDRAPLRPALLRLLDAHGRVIAKRTAERPLAELSTTHLYGSNRRTYLFTVDFSAGFGSYSGPMTHLAEPDARGFGWLIADSAGVSRDTISLVSTLKTGWRTAPRADGRGQDLLMVLCRPDFHDPDTSAVRFVRTFQRYSFVAQHWIVLQRQEPGFWESDDEFPPPAKFP